MFITFIFRLGESPETYYGKYVCEYVTSCEKENVCIDTYIRKIVIYGVDKYRLSRGFIPRDYSVTVGILSICEENYIPFLFSDDETNCFDLYCVSEKKIHVFGESFSMDSF